MAIRYIPPHLRVKARGGIQGAVGANKNPTDETRHARRSLSELRLSDDDDRPLHTIRELNRHFGNTLVHSTLRDTFDRPGQLGYVVLFRNANPKWETEHVIFAHTNIDILPGYKQFKQILQMQSGFHAIGVDMKYPANDAQGQGAATDVAAETGREHRIPVFMLVGGRRGARNVVFHGYFRLGRIDFLKPHSPELVRMLQQKWTPVQDNANLPPSKYQERQAAAWAKSLDQEWAVIQFHAVPKEEALQSPKIGSLADERRDSAGESTDYAEFMSGDELLAW